MRSRQKFEYCPEASRFYHCHSMIQTAAALHRSYRTARQICTSYIASRAQARSHAMDQHVRIRGIARLSEVVVNCVPVSRLQQRFATVCEFASRPLGTTYKTNSVACYLRYLLLLMALLRKSRRLHVFPEVRLAATASWGKPCEKRPSFRVGITYAIMHVRSM